MKYFIKRPEWDEEREVDKETYVDAEREEGFYNTLGMPREPATSAFKGANRVSGHVELESIEDFGVPNRYPR